MRQFILTISLLFMGLLSFGQPMRAMLQKKAASTPTGITYINSAYARGGATLTTTATACTGANLIVIGVTFHGSTSQAISDNQSNTYTRVRLDNGTNPACAIYYCAGATVSGSMTFTLTNTGGSNTAYTEMAVVAVSGANATPLDKQSGTNGFGTSAQPGSVTPTANGELIFCTVNYYTTDPGTWNSSLTTIIHNTIGANYYAGGFGWYIQPTATAINPAVNPGSGDSYAISLATFKP